MLPVPGYRKDRENVLLVQYTRRRKQVRTKRRQNKAYPTEMMNGGCGASNSSSFVSDEEEHGRLISSVELPRRIPGSYDEFDHSVCSDFDDYDCATEDETAAQEECSVEDGGGANTTTARFRSTPHTPGVIIAIGIIDEPKKVKNLEQQHVPAALSSDLPFLAVVEPPHPLLRSPSQLEGEQISESVAKKAAKQEHEEKKGRNITQSGAIATLRKSPIPVLRAPPTTPYKKAVSVTPGTPAGSSTNTNGTEDMREYSTGTCCSNEEGHHDALLSNETKNTHVTPNPHAVRASTVDGDDHDESFVEKMKQAGITPTSLFAEILVCSDASDVGRPSSVMNESENTTRLTLDTKIAITPDRNKITDGLSPCWNGAPKLSAVSTAMMDNSIPSMPKVVHRISDETFYTNGSSADKRKLSSFVSLSSTNDLDLISDELSQQQQDEETTHIEAQRGIPVIVPGAFAIEGFESHIDTGYDSGFEEGYDGELQQSEQFQQELEGGEQTEYQDGMFVAQDDLSEISAELVEEAALVAGQQVPTDEIEGQDHDTPIYKTRVFYFSIGFVVVASIILSGILIVISHFSPSSSPFIQPHNDDHGVPLVGRGGWQLMGNTSLRGNLPMDDSVYFGYDTSLSGNGQRVVVGMPGWDYDENQRLVGIVFIMDWDGTHWPIGAALKGPAAGAEAGMSVEISKDGRYVAISSPYWEGSQGHVAIYQEPNINSTRENIFVSRKESEWTMVGSAIVGEEEMFGHFGSSISLSGDGNILAVGASSLDGRNGQKCGPVRVYQQVHRNQTNNDRVDKLWKPLGQRDVVVGGDTNFCAWSVCLSANGLHLAISAVDSNDFTGQVRIFDFVNGVWKQFGQFLDGVRPQSRYGQSLSLSDDGSILAVGAPGYFPEDTTGRDLGQVQIFLYSEDLVWVQLGQDLVGKNQYDLFGNSVSLSEDGNTVAVGSPRKYFPGGGQISVFEYNQDSDLWIQKDGDIRNEPSSPIVESNSFGWSVSISSDGRRVAGSAPDASFDGRLFDVGYISIYETIDPE